MGSIKVTITGLREVQSALRRLADDAPRVLSPALAAATKPVRDAIEAEAPQDTGYLRHHIEALKPRTSGTRIISEVRVDATYAGHVDLGTHEVEAQHFAERGLDIAESDAVREFTREASRVMGK